MLDNIAVSTNSNKETCQADQRQQQQQQQQQQHSSNLLLLLPSKKKDLKDTNAKPILSNTDIIPLDQAQVFPPLYEMHPAINGLTERGGSCLGLSFSGVESK